MNEFFSRQMLEATRLTRDGKLTEATSLLQRALRGEAPPGQAEARDKPADFWAAGGSAWITDAGPEPGDSTAPASALPNEGGAQPRRTVSETWRSAVPFGEILQPGQPKTPQPDPTVGQFIARSHTGRTGTLGYKLYIPSSHRARPMPLIVMLHGCTQSPDDFAAGTRMNALAEEQGCLVAYPGQTQSANAQKCWNWFSPDNQRRDSGEPALIAGITRDIMRDHAVDEERVFIAGLSAGGAAAAVMGAAYAELYAAVGVHSGLACGAAHDLPSAFAAMRGRPSRSPAKRGKAASRVVPTITFHGDQDGTVHPSNADQVIAQSSGPGALGCETSAGSVPGGHAYRRTLHTDASGRPVLEQWLVHGAGHAWSGGSTAGSYTDARGPDASREMLRFFLEQAKDARDE